MKRRWAALAGTVGAALLAGCSPAAEPVPTTPPPPAIARPVDLSAHLDNPCSIVPTELRNRLTLTKVEEFQDQKAIPDSDSPQSDCKLTPPGRFDPVLQIFLLPAIRPVPTLDSPEITPQLTRFQVRDYPAALWRIGSTSASGSGMCNLYVDLGERQGIVLTYHRQPGPGTDPCEPPLQAADTVVANLAR